MLEVQKWLREAGIPFLWGEQLQDIREILAAHDDPYAVPLVVTNLVFPDCGGMDFLDWIRRELPTARILVVGGYFSETLRHLLEETEEVVAVLGGREFRKAQFLDTVRRSLAAPRRGFEGRMFGLSLFDFLQIVAMSGQSLHIQVKESRRNREGVVVVDHGQIIYAETHDKKGKDALYDMIRWPSGSFSASPLEGTYPQLIREPTDFLLLEFARSLDEEAQKEVPTRPTDPEIQHLFQEIADQIPGFLGMAFFDAATGRPLDYLSHRPEFTFVTSARLYSEIVKLVGDATEIATRGREKREEVDLLVNRDQNDWIILLPFHAMRFILFVIFSRAEGDFSTALNVLERYRDRLQEACSRYPQA